ncbi:MAG TPA: hypothetical protein EYO73_01965 [Sulfurimonas sp.]|nr:hypothetical protein [Sulfurimonas sp.]
MKRTPLYLNDSFMIVHKLALIFSFMLGQVSILISLAYAIFIGSAQLAFILFLKAAGLATITSCIGFMDLWKKHQLDFNNCKEYKTNACIKLA